MNGIEKILDKLRDDSQTECNTMLDQAKQEAAEITARYQAQARQIKEDTLEKGRRAADERQERLASVAQMEAKKMVLSAKQRLLDRAFLLAHDKLAGLPQEEYISLLSSLACGAAYTGTEAITLNAKDRKAIGRQVTDAANEKLQAAGKPAKLTLSKETAEIAGGLLLGDGSSEVNCAFDTLLRLNRGDMASEVAAVLFD